MVRKTGHGRLDEALALLINNQSSFLGQLTQLAARTDDRFSHIEVELAEIKAILLRHEHMLQMLPEAIREKIGFKSR